MGMSEPAFYDDDTVFTTYIQHRERRDNPNDSRSQIREFRGEGMRAEKSCYGKR
jgi:hypothetical protein